MFDVMFFDANQSVGLVKNHFYHIWVQLGLLRKSKELRRLHEVLSEVCPTVDVVKCSCPTWSHS